MNFWTLAAMFLASFLLAFSGALVPGPLLTVTIEASMRMGAKAGPLATLGHALLELVLVVAVFFGLGSFLVWPTFQGAIGLIGGGFLIWMAYGMLSKAGHGEVVPSQVSSSVKKRSINPVLAGLLVSASNPYFYLWWMSVGASSLLFASTYGIIGLAFFYVGHILADFVWHSAVSTTVSRGSRLFTPKIFRTVNAVCGLFLIALAIYFMYTGLAVFVELV